VPTNAQPTAPPANALPTPLPTSNPINSNGNGRQPSLGQPMPPIAASARRIAAPVRAVGNAVNFKIAAKPGSTVNIYRNGILVSSVPAAAAAALKVTDNPIGENSFQVVVVEQNGNISVSEKSMVITRSAPNSATAGKAKKNSSVSLPAKSANGKAATPKKAANGKAATPKKAANGKAAAPKKTKSQSKALASKNSK
jgi:hypothetical protein